MPLLHRYRRVPSELSVVHVQICESVRGVILVGLVVCLEKLDGKAESEAVWRYQENRCV